MMKLAVLLTVFGTAAAGMQIIPSANVRKGPTCTGSALGFICDRTSSDMTKVEARYEKIDSVNVEAGPTCQGSDGEPWQCHHDNWMCCPPPCQDVCAMDDQGCKNAEAFGFICDRKSWDKVFHVKQTH